MKTSLMLLLAAGMLLSFQPTVWSAAQRAPAPSASEIQTMQKAVETAHQRALMTTEYQNALLAKNMALVKQILVRNGAPEALLVRFDDTRPTTVSRIKITVKCCPLEIIIQF